MEFGRFDAKSFRYKKIRYKLKSFRDIIEADSIRGEWQHIVFSRPYADIFSTGVERTSVLGYLRMRKQNTKATVPLDVVPERRTRRCSPRFLNLELGKRCLLSAMQCRNVTWIKQTTVENNYAIAIATLSDWLTPAPGFQLMRSNAKTNRTLYAP